MLDKFSGRKEARDEIISKIKQNLTSIPMKIISAVLYGSWATGLEREDSDIDILVVAEGLNPKIHKRGREIGIIKRYILSEFPLDILLLTPEECISNFKNHNPLFLYITTEGVILVDKDKFIENLMTETRSYIESRGLKKLHDGWSFPVSYREATPLSEVTNKDFAIAMLTDGKHDYEIGKKIMGDGYYDKAVYHYQQAIEKSTKSVLICFGEFKKTHFVGKILIDKLKEIQLENEWKNKLKEAGELCAEVEPEVTWSRYPGIDSGKIWVPYEEYTHDDAEEVRKKSEKVLSIASEFVRWWFKE